MEFENVKKKILEQARKANACAEGIVGAKNANNYYDLCLVVRSSFEWCAENQLITTELVLNHLDDCSRANIFANENVKNGFCLVDGKHEITAEGHSFVIASGDAVVKAFDTTYVVAFGNATVTLHDDAVVKAMNTCHVDAYDFSKVRANDHTTVNAFNCSYVIKKTDREINTFDHAFVHDYHE